MSLYSIHLNDCFSVRRYSSAWYGSTRNITASGFSRGNTCVDLNYIWLYEYFWIIQTRVSDTNPLGIPLVALEEMSAILYKSVKGSFKVASHGSEATCIGYQGHGIWHLLIPVKCRCQDKPSARVQGCSRGALWAIAATMGHFGTFLWHFPAFQALWPQTYASDTRKAGNPGSRGFVHVLKRIC